MKTGYSNYNIYKYTASIQASLRHVAYVVCVAGAVSLTHFTEVMIRQLPRGYTQKMLLQEACRRGFEGLIDFLYVPFSPSTLVELHVEVRRSWVCCLKRPKLLRNGAKRSTRLGVCLMRPTEGLQPGLRLSELLGALCCAQVPREVPWHELEPAHGEDAADRGRASRSSSRVSGQLPAFFAHQDGQDPHFSPLIYGARFEDGRRE